MDIHTYPINDLKPHDTESRLCPCRPRVEPILREEACKYGDPLCPCQDGDVCLYEGFNPFAPPNAHVIHNSWDGREITERAADHAFNEGRN